LTIKFNFPDNLKKNTVVIFDHDLGGGTAFFRSRLIDEYLQNEWAIILVKSKDQQKQRAIQLTWYDKNEVVESSLMESAQVFALLSKLKPQNIYVNSIVSFRPFIIFIKELFAFLSHISNANIKVAIHDFYPICPSLNLLNYEWKFCNVPDETECIKCRSRHHSGMLKEPAITDWRLTWAQIFVISTEVIVFSESSKKIMLKAFPDLNYKITIRPHSMRYFNPQTIFNPVIKPTHIGVIGHITRAKGAAVIECLSNYMERYAPEIKITIFGNITIEISNNNVCVLGHYEINKLPELIEKQNITVFFMPSICPETFSFATHELILMQYPVVAFNLGAQGDTIKKYPRGKVVEPSISMKELFNTLNLLSLSI
tara:strand:+ start:5547 stop:6656 length:1110 start_codon:yes stop_codon:yes gene_type:complete